MPGDLRERPVCLRPGEIGRLFRVHPKTVTRWVETGKLTSIRTPGGHGRIATSDFERLWVELGGRMSDLPWAKS